MSCLKLYWPQTPSHSLALYSPSPYSPGAFSPDDSEWQEEAADDNDSPVILSFPGATRRRASGPQGDLLSRARLLRQNRCCPICSRAAVVPVNAEPALMTKNHMPIPGNSAIVGFECDSCGHAWGTSS